MAMVDKPMHSLMCRNQSSQFCKHSSNATWVIKMVFSMIYDLVGFLSVLLIWIPGIHFFWSIIGVAVGYVLWGPLGLINVWEVFTVTPVLAPIGDLIPTMTITGVLSKLLERKRAGKGIWARS
jgi:hypothetical protein